jgi:hypothetical protein
MNSDIHLKCELHVTVKLYRGTCSLYDEDPYFLRIRGIRVSAFFLMSVPLHNTIKVRMLGYQRKNKVKKLRTFYLNLISNSVCALA